MWPFPILEGTQPLKTNKKTKTPTSQPTTELQLSVHKYKTTPCCTATLVKKRDQPSLSKSTGVTPIISMQHILILDYSPPKVNGFSPNHKEMYILKALIMSIFFYSLSNKLGAILILPCSVFFITGPEKLWRLGDVSGD